MRTLHVSLLRVLRRNALSSNKCRVSPWGRTGGTYGYVT
jgi:hypothetical protein